MNQLNGLLPLGHLWCPQINWRGKFLSIKQVDKRQLWWASAKLRSKLPCLFQMTKYRVSLSGQVSKMSLGQYPTESPVPVLEGSLRLQSTAVEPSLSFKSRVERGMSSVRVLAENRQHSPFSSLRRVYLKRCYTKMKGKLRQGNKHKAGCQGRS